MKKNINVQNLILLVVFSVPLYLIKFSIGGISTNILEILIYFLFIFFIFSEKNIGFKDIYKKYKIYILGIVLIFLGLLISTVINKNWYEGLGIIKGWFSDPLLLAFVIIESIKTRKDSENILKSLYLSTLVVSLIGIFYLISGNLTYDFRLKAFYLSPNYLAMFLSPAVFIGIYLFQFQSAKFKVQNYSSKFKINLWLSFLIFSLLIIILNLYLTYSYAAWISIILALAITLLIQKKWKIILMIATIFLAIFATQISNTKLNKLTAPRSSLESRIMIWHSASKILKDNPFFGIGPGNFQNKYLEYQKYFPPYLEWAVPQPHNLYIAFWLESGILGLSGFLLIIFVWLKNIIPQIKNQKNSHALLAATLFSIMIYILIHGLFDTPYWKNDLSVIFWIIFSLGIICCHSRESGNPEKLI
jgi:putative inorganic carbon (hco3(-)) transporter